MKLLPVAIYNDGTSLELKNASYQEIDRSKLVCFSLCSEEGKNVFQLILKKDQRLIWRKRVITTVGGQEHVWHLVGWQKTMGGENIQCIAYISEDDGAVIMAGEWEGEHILLGKVELLDFE